MSLALEEVTEDITTSFEMFSKDYSQLLHIESEDNYELASDIALKLETIIGDTNDHPLYPLMKMIDDAIEAYEDNDLEVQAFMDEIDSMPTGIPLLITLMDQYQLTGNDFKEEIGHKSTVSKILSGDRELTKNHIQKLSARFDISPALFF